MTTAEIRTSTETRELELIQIHTIMSIAESEIYWAGYLLTGNRKKCSF